MPSNFSDEADLQNAIEQIPPCKFWTVLGNYKAYLRQEDSRNTYHTEDTIRKGQHLVSFLREHNLLATSTQFQNSGLLKTVPQTVGDKLTSYLIQRKWRSSIPNVEAYSNANTVSFDHSL